MKIMHKLGMVWAMLLTFYCGFGQYYYQEFVAGKQSASQFTLLRKLGIKEVQATSTEPDGSPTPNFILFQRVQGTELTTYSKSDYTGTSVLTSRYNTQGQVTLVVDSSSSIVNRSTYTYDSKGQLAELNMRSYDISQKFTLTETTRFTYTDSGRLQAVTRIKNNTDTMRVVIVAAENGLPGEEQWWKGNRKIETWYYYYDAQNRLTDIVRYHPRAQKMLPDFLFEYQEDGRLTSYTTVNPSTGLYRVWTYTYDNRGLKTSETVTNKYKQKEGSINYQYR